MSAVQDKRDVKRTKSLIANFKLCSKERHSYLDYAMDEQDVGRWWVRIRDIEGLEDEFKGGEYIIEMLAPADYPFGPPKFYVKTPNGVYETNVNVCVSIGHFHKENFASGQGGMHGFAAQLLNGLLVWKDIGVGIGLLHPEYHLTGGYGGKPVSADVRKFMSAALIQEKKCMAAASREYNLKHMPEIVKRFQ